MTNEEAAVWFEARLKNIAMPGAREMHKMAISALRAQEWISADERLPEKTYDNSSDDVLIAIRYEYDLPEEKETLCVGYLLDDEWWAYQDHNCHKIGGGIWKGDTVTHWRPLPEPPKGE